MAIKIKYITEDDKLFDSENAALIYEMLKEIDGVYLEKFKLEKIANALADKLLPLQPILTYGRDFKAPVVKEEIAVKSGVGIHNPEDFFIRGQELKQNPECMKDNHEVK